MAIVICNENRNEIETIKSFWRIRGITNFVLFDYINRSGNLDIDYYFTRNDRYMAEAENIMRENGDGNINGHPVEPGWGEGPYEAILAYEREFPHDYLHDEVRENKFGFSFAPYGYLIRK